MQKSKESKKPSSKQRSSKNLVTAFDIAKIKFPLFDDPIPVKILISGNRVPTFVGGTFSFKYLSDLRKKIKSIERNLSKKWESDSFNIIVKVEDRHYLSGSGAKYEMEKLRLVKGQK